MSITTYSISSAGLFCFKWVQPYLINCTICDVIYGEILNIEVYFLHYEPQVLSNTANVV